MPFKSEKQRRYLWANEPAVARRWAHEDPADSGEYGEPPRKKKKKKRTHDWVKERDRMKK